LKAEFVFSCKTPSHIVLAPGEHNGKVTLPVRWKRFALSVFPSSEIDN